MITQAQRVPCHKFLRASHNGISRLLETMCFTRRRGDDSLNSCNLCVIAVRLAFYICAGSFAIIGCMRGKYSDVWFIGFTQGMRTRLRLGEACFSEFESLHWELVSLFCPWFSQTKSRWTFAKPSECSANAQSAAAKGSPQIQLPLTKPLKSGNSFYYFTCSSRHSSMERARVRGRHVRRYHLSLEFAFMYVRVGCTWCQW